MNSCFLFFVESYESLVILSIFSYIRLKFDIFFSKRNFDIAMIRSFGYQKGYLQKFLLSRA